MTTSLFALSRFSQFTRSCLRRRQVGAVTLAVFLSAPLVLGFNEYPAPVQVSASEMGRGVATDGQLIFVGADTFGNDTGGSNSGDDYVGAAFLFQRGNHYPLRSYFGTSYGGNVGLDTAMSSHALVAAATQPPTVHVAASVNGQYAEEFTQQLNFAGPFWARPSVDMSGRFLVVGVRGAAPQNGQVLVFEYDPAAGRFLEPGIALEPPGGVQDPEFGTSVAIDGDRVIVGSPGSGNVGAVHIFERDGSEQWAQTYAGAPRLVSGGGRYGSLVDISGSRAIASDPESALAGSFVQWLRFDGNRWVDEVILIDAAPSALSISGDKAALGFALDNRVDTFYFNGQQWTQMGGFYPNDLVRVGAGVDMAGDFVAMGAPSYSEGAFDYLGALFTANIWESFGGMDF